MSSSRSRTVASRARSCPRTSLSARKPKRSPSSSPSTPGRPPRIRLARARRPARQNRRATMLDLKLLRSEPERVKAALARRGVGDEVDELLTLDARRRELLPQVEDAQAERNAASKRIGEIKREGGDAEAEIAAVAKLRETIDAGKEELEAIEGGLRELTLALPNIPDDDAPDGIADEDAVVIREVGALPRFDFEPRDHLTIGTELGLIDMGRAARLSGSRFSYLKGDLVLLELALVRVAMDIVRA